MPARKPSTLTCSSWSCSSTGVRAMGEKPKQGTLSASRIQRESVAAGNTEGAASRTPAAAAARWNSSHS